MALVTSANYTQPNAATYQSEDTDTYSRADSYTNFLIDLDAHDSRTGKGLAVGRLTTNAIADTANTGECQVTTGGLIITDGITQNTLLDSRAAGNGQAGFKNLGVTGATAASRFVGATASGAPVTGTFLVGDYIVDQTGSFWICTVAGSPGTWTNAPNASNFKYLGKGTTSTPATIVATTSPGTDIGCSVTGTPDGTHDVKILFNVPGPTAMTSAGAGLHICVQKDGSVIQDNGVTAGNAAITSGNGASGIAMDAAPSNAAHTYKLSGYATAGNITLASTQNVIEAEQVG